MIEKILKKLNGVSRVIVYIAIKLFGKNKFYKDQVVEDIHTISSVNNKREDVVKYYINKVSICILVLIVFSVLAILSFCLNKSNTSVKSLNVKRNSYGKGNKSLDYNVKIKGWEKSKNLNVSISEREYTKGEFEGIITKNLKKFEKKLLDKNESFKTVKYNFNETGKFLDYPFNVNFYTDNSDIISSGGEIKKEDIKKTGEEFKFHFDITYKDFKKNFTRRGKVFPPDMKESEITLNSIKKEIKEIDTQNINKEYVKLPDKIDGKKILWTKKINNNSLLIFFFGIIIAILLFIIKDKRLHESVEKRNRQMRLDYPELISTFVLLLGSGLSTRKVWEKITIDKGGKKRCVYDEMKYTLNEMKSGVNEKRAYEHFMERCNLKEYTKFITLLLNNIEKGSKDLCHVLELEAIDAYKARRNIAKLKGEEAGTKLLLPMAMMLFVVLMVVMIPAFLEMNV